MAERDYIAATKERVVVFDGGIGATLEQFELTEADYGGLQGKCHEVLVLNRPDVIEGVGVTHLRYRIAPTPVTDDAADQTTRQVAQAGLR